MSKFKIVLPENFNDILISCELKFKNGNDTIECIRNLLYLYSKAMEYYDSINNQDAYSYYLNKNNDLLTNQRVVSLLDKLSQDQTPIKLFEDKNNLVESSKITIMNEDVLNKRYKSIHKKEEILKIKQEAEEIVRNAVNNLTEKFESFSKHWMEQLSIQNNTIREEYLKQSNTITARNSLKQSIKTHKSLLKKSFQSKTSLIEASVAQIINKNETPEEALMKLLEEEGLNEKDPIDEEINNAVNKINIEMENEILEIRNSYKDDINNFIEMGDEYKQVVEGMKEDMESEIENLKDQFEERKRVEIEKITKKFK